MVQVAVMMPVPGVCGRCNQDGDRQKGGSAKQVHHLLRSQNAVAKMPL